MNTKLEDLVAKISIDDQKYNKNTPINREEVETLRDFINKMIEDNRIQAAMGFKFMDEFLPASSTIKTLTNAQADSLNTYIEKHDEIASIDTIFIQPCPKAQRYPRVITYRVLNDMYTQYFGNELQLDFSLAKINK